MLKLKARLVFTADDESHPHLDITLNEWDSGDNVESLVGETIGPLLATVAATYNDTTIEELLCAVHRQLYRQYVTTHEDVLERFEKNRLAEE
jgi:hypothetical protein